MRLGEFIRSRAVTLCFLGIGGAALAALLLIAGAGGALAAAAVLALALLTLGWLVCGWLTERRRLARLRALADSLPEKYLLGELLPPPQTPLEREYFEVMRAVSRSAIGAAEEARRDKEDYCAYVESWIHELKTPLTACSLILANSGEPRKLKKELRRADNLCESILYYARLRTAGKDVQIKELSAARVLDEAVRSQMELLIAAGVSAEVRGNARVFTDEKLLLFIIKQLLINCARYCPGCRVTLSAAEGRVTVADNGPGIAAHELPRVTERGFTGEAGRRLGGSTGMGLYIVAQLCEALDIGLDIASRPGEGTVFTLNLTKP